MSGRVIYQARSVRKVEKISLEMKNQIEKLFISLMRSPDPKLVNIKRYSFKVDESVLPSLTFPSTTVSYTMELLHRLNDEEEKIVDAYGDVYWEEFGTCKKEYILECKDFLSKCKNKTLLAFLDSISKFYYDIHRGNIMKDKVKNYKAVDITEMDIQAYMNISGRNLAGNI